MNTLDFSDTQESESDLLLLKFLLKEYLTPDKAETDSFKIFIHSLRSDYETPSAEKLREIAQNVNAVSIRSSNKLCRYLILVSQIIDDDLHALCLAVDVHGNLVFIDYSLKNSTPETQRSILEEFLKQSLTIVLNEYNVKISFILYDGPVLLSEKIKQFKVFLIISLKMFLNHIQTLDINLGNEDDFKVLVKECKKLSLAEASEKILKIFFNKYEDLNDDSLNAFREYLSPVILAANYFHSSFKGKLFDEFDNMNCKLQNFFIEDLPNEAFEGLAFYKSGGKIFATVNSKKLTQERYWSIVCSEFPTLGSYVLDLIKIKASPNVDLYSAIQVVNDYNCGGNFNSFKNILALLIN